MKIGYWNIEGLNIASSTPKLEDPRVLNEVVKHDIFGFAETHCDDKQNISIEGYKCFKICRSKSKKINRCYGGIAILYKESLQLGFKFQDHKNNDYIWIRLCKNFFNLTPDAYMHGIYPSWIFTILQCRERKIHCIILRGIWYIVI